MNHAAIPALKRNLPRGCDNDSVLEIGPQRWLLIHLLWWQHQVGIELPDNPFDPEEWLCK